MLDWNSYLSKRSETISNRRTRFVKVIGNRRYLITKSRQLLNFVSNDYLGLSFAPEIIYATKSNCDVYGIGSGGAPSLSGYSIEHHCLANEMAEWFGYEKCLLFNSGFQLNVGIFSQLIDSRTKVWFDKNCHASHIDGILLSRAKFATFDETNIDAVINSVENQLNYRHLILSEGSFSMTGTCNYWHKLIQLKIKNPNNTLLIIDDAHGIGAFGKNGYGSLEQLNLSYQDIDVVIGTFGKAFGTHGGFICSSAVLIDYLQQNVRSQIFSTNIPPCIAAASRASLAIIKSHVGHNLRQQLASNINYFQSLADESGLHLAGQSSNYSAIQLLMYSNQNILTKIYSYLLEHNILVGKIMYPTVPIKTPRLRISLNAQHTKDDIELLVKYLAKAESIYNG